MSAIEDLQALISEYQVTIDTCNKQIDRLEKAYTALGDIKSDFQNARKSTNAVFSAKGLQWRGKKHTDFCNAGASLDDSMADYYNRIDIAQDSVNRKIGELKAKRFELIPIIGDLAKKIEQLKAEAANMMN